MSTPKLHYILVIKSLFLNILLVKCSRKFWNPIETPTILTHSDPSCGPIHWYSDESITKIEKTVELTEIILSSSGYVILQPDSEIKFTEVGTKCSSKLSNVILHESKPKSWLNTSNWRSEGIVNSATPHMDLIPCHCDSVVFNSSNSDPVDLRYVSQLKIGSITINNEVKNSDQFRDFLTTKLGQTMFHNFAFMDIPPVSCNPQTYCGCHDYASFSEYLPEVCSIEKSRCPIPMCMNPILPIGHCCKICGDVLEIKLQIGEDTCDMDLDRMNTVVSDHLRKSSDYVKNLEYFLGLYPVNKAHNVIQLIVVEKREYTGLTADFINSLATNYYFSGPHTTRLQSGRPYMPNQDYNSFTIIFVSLLIVTVFFYILHIYYIQQPKWMTGLTNFQLFKSPFVFARFDNRADDNQTLCVDVDYEAEGVPKAPRRFDNPLYQSGPANVKSIGKVDDDELITTLGPVLLNEESTSNGSDNFQETTDLVEVELVPAKS